MKDKKRLIILLLVGFLGFLAAACLLAVREYTVYQEKIEIIAGMLKGEDSGQEGIGAAAGILKGNLPGGEEEALLLLESYGLLKSGGNVFYTQMQRSYAVALILCAAGFLFYSAALCLLHGGYVSKRREELETVRRMLLKMREERLQEVVTAEDETAGKRSEMLPGLTDMALLKKDGGSASPCDETMSRLQMELDSLAAHLGVVGSKARKDREGTKALVTDISHQLRNPVAALKTSFEILSGQKLSAQEREEFYSRCAVQIGRLEELTGALVNISRMETGMIAIHLENAVIFDTVVTALGRLYPQILDKQMEVELEAEEELKEIRLPHDPKWLGEALISVLENAVKYSQAGTVITITMIKMTVFLRIEIEDQGMGIPKEEWNRIFQRFYRGKDAQESGEQGSGVGLYLAREIVEYHHGTLTAALPHGEGTGSRFVFQLRI